MESAQITFADGPTGAEAPQVTAERPANVPEKFWDSAKGSVNTEALLASYANLEGKLGAPKADTAPVTETTAETTTETKTEEAPKDEGEKIAEAAGLDMVALGDYFAEHGELPQADYDKLAALGIAKEDADGYAQFRMQQAETLRSEMMAPFGGDEGVAKMQEWATKHFTQEQAVEFNAGVDSGDRTKIEASLTMLKTVYEKANGVKPQVRLQGGNTQNVIKGDRFESMAQQLSAQSDPRYKSDPAFRDEVIAKIGRSAY